MASWTPIVSDTVSVLISNSFKKGQPLILLPKIDGKMEQYAHAVEVSVQTHTLMAAIFTYTQWSVMSSLYEAQTPVTTGTSQLCFVEQQHL